MNHYKICGIIALACISSSTFATGTITFSGLLVGSTCATTVSASNVTASASPTITLPTLTNTIFTSAGTVAGKTPFTIHLEGADCSITDSVTTTTKFATPYFVNDTSKINDQGRVTNVTGTATNVDIQILNNTSTPINLATDETTQIKSTSTGTEANKTNFLYYAQYYSTAASVAAGTVGGSVTYNLIYK